jgi:hypothetical protein
MVRLNSIFSTASSSINGKEEEEDDDQSMFIEVHEGFSASVRYLGGCGECAFG